MQQQKTKPSIRDLFFKALLLLLPGMAGCGVLQQKPKYAFTSGFYKMKHDGPGKEKVYAFPDGDDYSVYRVDARHHVDTNAASALHFPLQLKDAPPAAAIFWQPSLDLDFLTIPLKYRPPVNSFPRQLNTNLNGAVYLGYRNDIYYLRYKQTPLGKTVRQTTHFGFSFGGFAGLGATAMNPSVTSSRIEIEYDGMVFTKGVAGIIGVNNVTLGLAVGFDNLLDKHHRFWVYQQKPWLGLAFGLNLN